MRRRRQSLAEGGKWEGGGGRAGAGTRAGPAASYSMV